MFNKGGSGTLFYAKTCHIRSILAEEKPEKRCKREDSAAARVQVAEVAPPSSSNKLQDERKLLLDVHHAATVINYLFALFAGIIFVLIAYIFFILNVIIYIIFWQQSSFNGYLKINSLYNMPIFFLSCI